MLCNLSITGRSRNPSEREVYLFVPDLHLVSPARRLHFGHYCLMDNGAWIEHCTYRLAEGDEVTEPSAQFGVIHGNDIRVYQIRVGVA